MGKGIFAGLSANGEVAPKAVISHDRDQTAGSDPQRSLSLCISQDICNKRKAELYQLVVVEFGPVLRLPARG
jgi:hypothetical protein